MLLSLRLQGQQSLAGVRGITDDVPGLAHTMLPCYVLGGGKTSLDDGGNKDLLIHRSVERTPRDLVLLSTAGSFSTRPGVFWTWGFSECRLPSGTAIRPRCWGKVSPHPCRGQFSQQGVVQRLKPPRKCVWISQEVSIIITCCRGYTVAGDSLETCAWRALNLQNPTCSES